MAVREQRESEKKPAPEGPIEFNFNQDSELQNQLKQTKDRIRGRSKNQILDVLSKFDKSAYIVRSKKGSDSDEEKVLIQPETTDVMKEIMNQLEETIFSKNDSVNTFYMKKITHCTDNLRYMLNYKDIAELFFSRKSFNLARLCQNTPIFKEWIQKVAHQRREKEKLKQKSKAAEERNMAMKTD